MVTALAGSTVVAQSTYTPPSWFRVTRALPLTELVTVQDVMVANYATINDGIDDLPGIIQALEVAKQAASSTTPVRVVFEQGTYDLFPATGGSHAIFFNNANSVVLEGNSANILIHNPEVGFFSMFQSENIIIKDLIIDYAKLPFTQGTVTARNFSNNSFTLNIDTGFPLLNEAHFANASEQWGMLKENDGRLKSGVDNLFSLQSAQQISGNQFQLFLKNGGVLSQIEVNDRYVQIARNNGRTIFRTNSGKNITYMGITSYASPAGSYNSFNMEEWNLINCKVLIKPGRIHSGNADIMHVNGGTIGPWVEGCRFEGQSDDAINIKNTKLNILSVISPTEIIGSIDLGTEDTLNFYNPRDGIFLGRMGLTKPAERIASGQFKITLAAPVHLTNLSDANVGDKAYVETRMNESFVFINDTIRNGRRYGMLLQNGYGVVENCVFENLSNSAIRMENGVDWGEGFVANNIRIADNRFINNGFELGFNNDPLGASITAMVSKLGNGSCDPWCGTELTDWNGLEKIWIENNYFEYNQASVNIHNYDVDGIEDLSLSSGFANYTISLSNAFDEVLGSSWTLAPSSSNPSIVTTSTANKILTITDAGGYGDAQITITATNNNGGKAYSNFKVSVSGAVFQGNTDGFWSKVSNWQSATKPAALSSALVDAENSFVDEAFTLSQVANSLNASTVRINGDEPITLQNIAGSEAPALLNQSTQGARFTINSPVIIDNITNAFTYLGNTGSSTNILELGTNSTLQINTRTQTYSQNDNSDRVFEFNGRLIGSNNLIFGNSTNNIFGASSSNLLFNGDLVFFTNSKVTVNTPEDSVFLPLGRKLQINGGNTVLTLNSANTMRGNISVAGSNAITLAINKNQKQLNALVISVDGTVKLVIDNSVDSVFFSDNSASAWGTGKLRIEGFRNGVIRFGSSAAALTSTQLGQIELDGVTNLEIDENGFLYGTSTAIFNGNSPLNNLWSNADNWSNGLKGESAEFAQFNASAQLDINATVHQVRSGGNGEILNGGGVLTVTGKGFTAAILQTGNDGTFNVDAHVILNSADEFENLQVNGTNGALTFGSNSDLTLNSSGRLNANRSSNRIINMNGVLRGNSALQIAANTDAVFGTTSNHSNFDGEIIYIGSNASIVSNTADNGTFVPSTSTVRVSSSACSLTLNGAHTFKGNLTLEGANGFDLTINKNQSSMSSIALGSATLALTIGAGVNSIWFEDNSTSGWNTGTLSINNFQNSVLRFGTHSFGLTEGQLSQINIGGGVAYLNAGAYLKAANSVWNGTSWSVLPSSSDDAIISGNLNSGSLEVNDLTIQSGMTVTIAAGETLKTNGDLMIHGVLNIESGGSLVTMGSVVGAANISRNTTFAENEGKYSAIGSPIETAFTSLLGTLIYAYDETIAYGSERFMKVTNPQSMAVGDAYFSAFTGDVTFTGKPNTGNVDLPLVYNTILDGMTNAGFNLVANPYPSAISYTTFVNASNNPDIDASIYIWDDGGSDQGRRSNADYIVMNSMGVAGSGSGRADDWNGFIGSAQGFFVKANSAGTLHFTDAMKMSGNNADQHFFRKAQNEIKRINIGLSASTTNERYSAIVGFAEDATEGFDRLYDATKMSGAAGFSVFTILDDQAMTIQGLPDITEELVLPLGFTVLEEGTYAFSFDSFSSLKDISVILQDLQTGKQIQVSEVTNYSFFSDKSVNNTSRFQLVFSPFAALNIANVDGVEVFTSKHLIEITQEKSTLIIGELIVSDIRGSVLLVREVAASETKVSIPFNFLSNRVYLISLRANGVITSKKVLFTE